MKFFGYIDSWIEQIITWQSTLPTQMKLIIGAIEIIIGLYIIFKIIKN